MAPIPRRLLLQHARSSFRIPIRRITPQTRWQRPLSTTAPRLVGNDPIDNRSDPKSQASQPVEGISTTSSTEQVPLRKRRVKKNTDEWSLEENGAALEKLSADLEALDPNTFQQAVREGKSDRTVGDQFAHVPAEAFEIEQDPPFQRLGFWAEGEPELGPDEDYYGDDLTSLGHGELEQHRELREYARLAAWELPLLNQLARPFELPTAKTPFRFRYTSYLGESHPAANKVVVEFSVQDMADLTRAQMDKLIKLAGPRYNPTTDVVKMSCELYDTLPQNKRHLGDTIKSLLDEAKNGEETFADVPFDFRHHKVKVRHEFPKEWVLTEERKKYLEAKRQQLLKAEDERTNNGLLVDGETVIDRSLPFITAASEPVALPVTPGRRR
ncbi:mitochondrial ribosomal subunit protein-domain-containing protein [Lophiotrema nucula]|uniref:Mitochondrial ribosomal subunit protein-domain-containing protein n=1 Tax=Lophiotrema nucula TaxID=690887 RepID=A0A6A5ZAM3_9PLEO|nr:mitochondrial ribosomal subunit protein-domain-containing protein [Lophiotrema nucula]